MDDPDHIAIKARAKEMQRQEMEEIRQREANETALQAIGFPKKRQKTGGGSDGTSLGEGGGLSASKNNGNSIASTTLGKSSSLTNNGGSSGDGGGSGTGGGGSSAGGGHFGSSNKPVSYQVVDFESFTIVLIIFSQTIKRIKRVTMKDVYFMMEHEHDTARSHSLYRTYAR